MIYEVLLTLVIALLGILVYMQYVKSGKVYLFQDAVSIRFSACYSDEEIHQDTGRSLVKLRLELLALSPQYKGICIEEIGFLKHKKIRLREFSRFFFTCSSITQNARELFILIEAAHLPEIRLNGLALYVNGYLLCSEHKKHDVCQKFIVFERPATLDAEELQSRA